MFIISKRRVILPSRDGSKRHLVHRDFIGEIPDWAAETDYFRSLVADGKIGVPESHKDKDTQETAEKSVKVRRGSKTTEE